jgi:soluble lytic murein transglycosylase-like protein
VRWIRNGQLVLSVENRPTAIPTAALALALLFQPARSEAGQQIVGIVAADGRIVLTNMGAYTHPATPTAGVPSRSPYSPYEALIEDISLRHGVDPRLTRAVIEIESGFDPNAVSPKGALGLMQLIPSTGERFGVNNFFDPADNIRGGVRFLRFLIEKFEGNTDLVLAAYNSGENRVERLGRVPAIPETLGYVGKVRAAYETLGGNLSNAALPLLIDADASRSASPAAVYRDRDERGVLKFSSFGPTR